MVTDVYYWTSYYCANDLRRKKGAYLMLIAIAFYLFVGLLSAIEVGFDSWLGYILFTLLWCPIMLMGLCVLALEAYENFNYKRKGDKNAKS